MPVNRERIQQWVEALRSETYTQDRGVLRNEKGWCCLGVACEVYRLATGNGEWQPQADGWTQNFVIRDEAQRYYMPHHVTDWFGLTRQADGGNPTLSVPQDLLLSEREAADLNDDGSTFEQIAQAIERTFLP